MTALVRLFAHVFCVLHASLADDRSPDCAGDEVESCTERSTVLVQQALLVSKPTASFLEEDAGQLCGVGTLLTQVFACFKADGIPVFARHGLLLGAVREKSLVHLSSRIDDDLDVGYLSEDRDAVMAYFRGAEQGGSAHCFAQHNIRVEKFSECTAPCGRQTCAAPSADVLEWLDKTASQPGMDPALRSTLKGMCTADSKMPGFSARFSGVVGGRFTRMGVTGSAFVRDGDSYFYDKCCNTGYNCPMEVRMWYTRYKLQEQFPLAPGEDMRIRFPASLFKPLRPAEFVLGPRRSAELMVPNNATGVVERLYGFGWQQPMDKKNLGETTEKPAQQAYLCND